MAGIILDPVKVATNVNITDIATKNWALGTEDIDGITDLAVGNRVLVKAQTFKSENGIYVFTTVSVNGVNRIRLVRASADFAANAQIQPNTCVFVENGNLHADTGWLVANNSVSTVGTTEIEFKRFTINLALGGIDLPSSIVLRKENGRPLTNDQLDGNFKYLYDSLVSKLDVSAFTPIAVRDKINTLDAEIANLDAWKLRGNVPSVGGLPNTIALRDGNSAIYSPSFVGDLEGNADTADLADFATFAGNVTGIVAVENGGTGASTASVARNNLIVVCREGDTITGKLTLNSGIQSTPIAPLNLAVGNPIIVADGDVWAGTVTINGQISDRRIFYRFAGTTRSIAHIESPNLEGTPTAPTAVKTTNNTTIANTAFVQLHVSDINTALNLKAPLASPALTGTPTTPTAATTVENTQIASTGYVKNKIDNILTSYDTSLAVNNKIQALSNVLTPTITTAQQTADTALERSGLPPGAIAYFAGNAIPLGWLKANGDLVNKVQYQSLFNVIGYTYGGGADFFRLPDLRGEFIRSLDDGRGIDSNRVLGSAQTSQVQKHKHVAPFSESWGGPFGQTDNRGYSGSGRSDGDNFLWHTNDASNYDGVVNAVGVIGNETRPRNVAMLACIKAFGAVDDPDQIVAQTVINSISTKVDKSGDSMAGPLTLNSPPTSPLHATTKQYVDTVLNTQVTTAVAAIPVVKGDKGDKGDIGNPGPPGPPGSAYTFTTGQTQVGTYTNDGGFTDNVRIYDYTKPVYGLVQDYEGGFYQGIIDYEFTLVPANQFDVFPPAGRTMSQLLAFIPSIRTIYFAGRVDGNDSLRCEYVVKADRITVYVQNSEQRYNATASWLAIWNNS